jgi:hypothetical protein
MRNSNCSNSESNCKYEFKEMFSGNGVVISRGFNREKDTYKPSPDIGK